MEIEEAIDILENIIDDEVIGTYCVEIQKKGVNCSKNCEDKEEKEVIEELKRIIKYSDFCDNIGTGQIEILLNYIDKLQKENETLKEENFDQVYMKAIADYKDKIREVLKDIYFYYGQDNDTFLVDKIRKELLDE